MNFGLTEDGFTIKRQPDIITSLEDDFRDEFGEINVGAESVFGQVIGVLSKPLIDLWELAELVYLSQYSSSSDGVSLDNVAQLVGITRLESTKTQVEGILIGDQGTVIPEGTQGSILETGDLFETKEEKTIDKVNILECTVSVKNVLNSTLYTITVDGTGYSITSDSDATIAEILGDLAFEINTTQTKVAATYIVTDMIIEVVDKTTPFSINVDSNLQIDSLSTPVDFKSKVTGSISAPAGTLTKIETPVSGLDNINNLLDGVEGRNPETDPELRARRRVSLKIAGAATVEAIKARILQEVLGVTNVSVYENRTDFYDGTIIVTIDDVQNSTDYSVYVNGTEFKITSDSDATALEIADALVTAINLGSKPVTAIDNTDGTFDVNTNSSGVVYGFSVDAKMSINGTRPPHSFEAVVIGGTDQDIGDKIWIVKPAGIQTHGNTSVDIEDSEGDNQVMKFSRPVNKYVWIKVEITLNPEETFPADGLGQVANNILELGDMWEIGDDLILQKFYAPVYEVEGISSVILTQDLTDSPGDTPSYGSINIPVGQVEIAVFALTRIDVSIP